MYAEPRRVDDLSDCLFYHLLDLPGLGTVGGAWDLRPTADEYLGRFDFGGKRALDVGTASGFLSFEMERRGATEVVSFDMDSAERLELVPFADPRYDMDARRAEFGEQVWRTRNAYWLAHRLLGSRARAIFGDVYALPDALGTFDVVVLGMILPHVRDPFRALASAAQLAGDAIIITQQAPGVLDAYAYFMPDASALAPYWAWWSMSEACVARMLGVVGFAVESIIRCEHACPQRGDMEMCSTYVARRQYPLA